MRFVFNLFEWVFCCAMRIVCLIMILVCVDAYILPGGPPWEASETLEAHVECRPAVRESEFDGLRMCESYAYKNRVSLITVWVDWGQSEYAELQRGQTVGDFGDVTWMAGNAEGTTQCLPEAPGRYCRDRRICSLQWVQNGYWLGPPWQRYVNAQFNKNEDRIDKCINCVIVPCKAWNCPAGTVNGKALETVAGKVVRLPECGVACSAGRFFTCSKLGTCQYQVYTQENARLDEVGAKSGSLKWYRDNVYFVKDLANVLDPNEASVPIKDCYPCRLANDLTHLGVNYGTKYDLYDDGYVGFTCPGGASAPVKCGENQVSRYDTATETASGCGCRPRFYFNSTLGKCAPCEPGYKCAWNGFNPPVLVPCEADTYSLSGQEQCTPCKTDASGCADGQALTRCKFGAKYQSQDAKCVSCVQCSQLGGETPCYGISSRVF